MPLDALFAHLKHISALGQISGVLSWDQEVMMPRKGIHQRAEQVGALARVIHGCRIDPRIPEWIAAIDRAGLDEMALCNIAEAERSYRRATRIPSDLAAAMAKAASAAQEVWTDARKNRDFALFAPALGELVALQREKASCLAEEGQTRYEVLLDDFERGMTTETLEALFGDLRAALVELREHVDDRFSRPALAGDFPVDRQMQVAARLAAGFGYDFEAGRLDCSVHPFSSGGGGDTRITTRTDAAEPFGCLYSTMHETGHALYGQGAIDAFLPAADYVSMGVHESQSRFWENQIGRSQPFMQVLWPMMREAFGDFGADSPDALYAAVNRVAPGFIRTEADEVYYNLHIMMRFDLERDLIEGRLDVSDLEEAWNTRFEQDFGQKVGHASEGVLQDVHWSAGLFGYFPTYTLGNIYAACLDDAMRAEMPDRDQRVASGEFGEILDWMRQRIHIRGRLLPPGDLIEAATGAKPSPKPLISYLFGKFDSRG